MKKYLFLSIIILFPICAFAQPFVVTAVKSGTVIPIDTIRPGENFGIRVIDAAAGSPNVYLWCVRRDLTGNWYYDTLDHIYPTTLQITGGIGSVDDAFFRTSMVMDTAKNSWIRIVASLSGPPTTGDSSKPLCVKVTPSSLAEYTIIANPNPMGINGPTLITVYTPEIAGNRTYDLKIVDAFGYVVRNLIKAGTGDPTGRYISATWDGTNDKGTKVSNGVYQICVKVMEAQEAGVWKKKIGVIW